MKKHRILLMLFVLCVVTARGQITTESFTQLSEQAYASILTCGPGEEFYESFGHSALRVCDSTNGLDVVFNYGSFDFNEPHFYLRFTQGRLNYFVERMEFDAFMFEYLYYGRAVWEQRLKLSRDELENLYIALETNALPKNKFYKYDLFWDNCATRVRDMVEKYSSSYGIYSGKETKWSPSDATPRTTYRDLIYKYTDKTLLWWRFGTDLLLGARCDRPMTKRQYMYNPIEMMVQFDTARMADGNTITEPRRVLTPQVTFFSNTVVTPALCFLLLFVVVLLLTMVSRKKGWKLHWLDAILFGTAGLASLILLFLWFGSDHACTKWNLNLLWLNPLFLWLVCRLRKPCRIPAIILTICLGLALLVWIVGWPQQLNTAAILLVMTLLVRVGNRVMSD